MAGAPEAFQSAVMMRIPTRAGKPKPATTPHPPPPFKHNPFSLSHQNETINNHFVLNAVGAIEIITAKLVTINAPAIKLTSTMLPRLAGNLPLMT